MKHLGDITKINGAEVEPVWVIIQKPMYGMGGMMLRCAKPSKRKWGTATDADGRKENK